MFDTLALAFSLRIHATDRKRTHCNLGFRNYERAGFLCFERDYAVVGL